MPVRAVSICSLHPELTNAQCRCNMDNWDICAAGGATAVGLGDNSLVFDSDAENLNSPFSLGSDYDETTLLPLNSPLFAAEQITVGADTGLLGSNVFGNSCQKNTFAFALRETKSPCDCFLLFTTLQVVSFTWVFFYTIFLLLFYYTFPAVS